MSTKKKVQNVQDREYIHPCEICNPQKEPICTEECQQVCPFTKNYRGRDQMTKCPVCGSKAKRIVEKITPEYITGYIECKNEACKDRQAGFVKITIK